MERAYDERIALYFCKKNVLSAFFLIILGFGIWSIGYNKETSYIFYIIGILFVVMGLWTWIKGSRTRITGKEVDDYILHYLAGFSLFGKALAEFELDKDDFEEMESCMLLGYSPISINTEPLFRLDKEDGKARSSNFQMSYFMFDDDLLLAYNQMKSLVDSEFKEDSHIWRYKSIKYCDLRTITKRCMIAPGKEENKENGIFKALIIVDMDNVKYGFSYDEKHEETAKFIANYINKRVYSDKRMRKPASKDKPDSSALSKEEKKILGIGVINDDFKDL